MVKDPPPNATPDELDAWARQVAASGADRRVRAREMRFTTFRFLRAMRRADRIFRGKAPFGA